MQNLTPPQNDAALLERCFKLVGKTLSELALEYPEKMPHTLTRSKGYIGQLIEWHLGAYAKNQSKPDFPNLNIELKTLPLNEKGKPSESTYVCTAPIGLELETETWRTSRVYQKLSRVLFIPIESDKRRPLAERRIGSPLLWEMDRDSEIILKQDWEELTELLCLGKILELKAHKGSYLQIRPKAAHSRILNASIDEEGEEILTNPRGFYLRTIFTEKILKTHYCLTS